MQIQSSDISLFPKNIALIKLIENKKQNLSFKDDDSSFNVSKIAKQEQVQEDDDANELITAINKGEQQAQRYLFKPYGLFSKSISQKSDEDNIEKEN